MGELIDFKTRKVITKLPTSDSVVADKGKLFKLAVKDINYLAKRTSEGNLDDYVVLTSIKKAGAKNQIQVTKVSSSDEHFLEVISVIAGQIVGRSGNVAHFYKSFMEMFENSVTAHSDEPDDPPEGRVA